MFFLEIRDSRACGLELWADIEGYEGKYQVSTYGNVRNLNYKGKKGDITVMKINKRKDRYCEINLNGKTYRLHRLVAFAFLYSKNRENLQVNHKDENPANNRVENLEWCTASYNVNYGTRNQRHADKLMNRPDCSKQVKQMTLDGKVVKTWESAREAARNGYHLSSIADCCRGRHKHKTYRGFKWAYA